MQESVRLKSFELVARDIAGVDPHLLHALTISVGWPHRPKDWELLIRAGQGIAAVDGIGRVFGTAMWFPHGDDFATIGLVITSPRTQAQGGGRWLMSHVLERCHGRDLALNATRAAHGLYLSLGFVDEASVHMRQGELVRDVPALPPVNGELSPLSADRLAEVLPLDSQAFGRSRERLLTMLSENASICVLRREGKVVGYSMRRDFGRGHVIGPVAASNADDALHLTAAHMESLKGQFVRVDTREASGPYATFLEQCGLTIAEVVTTMSKGRRFLNRQPDQPLFYGLAGHALS
ncbi:GNAT family N-acetyltransferase [uncultured Devosia sp.]|uniref:GNAT family N-acetyltransferase n=1 Tax=uncultured Devosia sp. TaxID=211434 RepID=UPI00260F76F7|nr:GNAT family N-acetyltransferase [uncultured Devosia sp.]